jgi:DNA-directed RNA polymerase subunit K/omega
LNEGAPTLIKDSGNEDVVTALREIAAGKVFVKEESAGSDESSQ